MNPWQVLFQGAAAIGAPAALAGTLVFAGCAVLAVRLAAIQRGADDAPARRWSTALRLTVALLLAALWFEPVFRVTSLNDLPGRLLVAVDLSESMHAADRNGANGSDGTSSDGTAEGEPITRKERALRIAAGEESAWTQTLPPSMTLDRAAFAGEARYADADAMRALAAEPPRALQPDGTDLDSILRLAAHAAAEPANDGTPLRGVVLLTDGRRTASRGVLELAERLHDAAVPVFPVLIATDDGLPDLSVASVHVPAAVAVGDRPRATARLRTAGFAGRDVSAEILLAGRSVAERTWQPAGAESTIEFDLPPALVGATEFTLRISPQPGEARSDNNERSFRVASADDAPQVIMLEGEARWEFRHLDSLFGGGNRVAWRPVVFRQPYLGVLPETFYARRLISPAAEGPDASPFAEADLVLVGDVAPDDLSAEQWTHLERFVADAGGTVVLISGRQNLEHINELSVMQRLLPVSGLRPVTIEHGLADNRRMEFALALTAEGEAEPMLRLDDDAARNRSMWSDLPGHVWGLTGTPKPGARVLAVSAPSKKVAEEADSRAGTSSGSKTAAAEPVIAVQNYGLGRVLWLGIDSTWRWRRGAGETLHQKFWTRLALWGAGSRYAAGNEHVRFGPATADIAHGEPIRIEARLSRALAARLDGRPLWAEVLEAGDGAGETSRCTFELKPIAGRPLVREGIAEVVLPAGDYRVRLTSDERGDELAGVSAALRIGDAGERERGDLRGDGALLGQVAAASGGTLLKPDELPRLSALLASSSSKGWRQREFPLWAHSAVLGVLLALLGVEWGIRIRNGLP